MLTTTAAAAATAVSTTMTTTTGSAMTITQMAASGSRSTSSSSGSGSGCGNSMIVSGEITDTTIATTTPKTMTTITSDPGILCFHHCNVKVFCFTLPHICPQCKTALTTYPSATATASGDVNSGHGGASQRRKNKIKLCAKNNKSNNNGNNKKEDSRHSIDSNKDDDANNHQQLQHRANDDSDTNEQNNNNDDDDSDDGDDDDDEDRFALTSHIMANSRLLPFRLPYPFVRANQYPCAIVLRPTTGDFLNDYNNTTDLHIAVTTSTGCVVEFDRYGLQRHRTDNMSEWWQCLLVGDVPEPWYDYWDQVLFEICQQPDMWTVSHYHEDKHNCYTFVLTFLQALTYDKLSEAATSKTRFCEKYIVPRTTTAGKYISLYRKLRDTGIYVHHTNSQKVQHYRKQLHQQQQQHHYYKEQHRHANKSNNVTTTTTTIPTAATTITTTATKNSWITTNNKREQQQHLSNHHNHHSIISRPHSTLCTIEE